MTREVQILDTILERDTDIILLEEFNVNEHFVEWFLSNLELPKATSINGTWRSISDFGLGETDLLFSYNSNNDTIFVLIENKLDADFQKQQYERYVQRGEKYKSKSKCVDYYVVLVAPKKYAEAQSNFEKFVTYEEIKEHLLVDKSLRLNFKAQLFAIAIEKSRRGYQAINCEPVQKFWKSYWSFKQDFLPNYRMNEPDIVPFGSDWIEMRDDKLKGIIFYHKLEKGIIDATFCGFSERIGVFVRDNLSDGYYFEKHKSSRFSIRQFINPIDRTSDFEAQLEGVKAGMKKIDEVNNYIKTKLLVK